jgi:hypothetical protein
VKFNVPVDAAFPKMFRKFTVAVVELPATTVVEPSAITVEVVEDAVPVTLIDTGERRIALPPIVKAICATASEVPAVYTNDGVDSPVTDVLFREPPPCVIAAFNVPDVVKLPYKSLNSVWIVPDAPTVNEAGADTTVDCVALATAGTTSMLIGEPTIDGPPNEMTTTPSMLAFVPAVNVNVSLDILTIDVLLTVPAFAFPLIIETEPLVVRFPKESLNSTVIGPLVVPTVNILGALVTVERVATAAPPI